MERIASILLSFVCSIFPLGVEAGDTATATITCNIVSPTVSVSAKGAAVFHEIARQNLNPTDISIILTASDLDRPVEFSIENSGRMSYSLSSSSSVRFSDKTGKNVKLDNFVLPGMRQELTGDGTSKLQMGNVLVKDKTADTSAVDIDADWVCITVNFN